MSKGRRCVGVDTLTSADFAGGRLTREPRTALVVFVADWCGYCRRFLRNVEPHAASFPVPVVTADVSDEEDPLWDDCSVRVVPTMILYRDGEPVWRADGRVGLGLSGKAVDEARERAAALAA